MFFLTHSKMIWQYHRHSTECHWHLPVPLLQWHFHPCAWMNTQDVTMLRGLKATLHKFPCGANLLRGRHDFWGRDVPNIGRGLSENRIPTNSTYIILTLYPHSPLPITLWHGFFWAIPVYPIFTAISPKKAMIRFWMPMGWSLAKRRLCDW